MVIVIVIVVDWKGYFGDGAHPKKKVDWATGSCAKMKGESRLVVYRHV